jgi:uncharacterized membrane protein YfhO
MNHSNFISTVMIVMFIIIIYKISLVELKTSDTAMTYYIIVLQMMTIAFDHIYDAYGDVCL